MSSAAHLEAGLEHPINRRHQPGKRPDGWRDSIAEHRDRVLRVLDDSPGPAGSPAATLAAE